jgi:hypothetical protein
VIILTEPGVIETKEIAKSSEQIWGYKREMSQQVEGENSKEFTLLGIENLKSWAVIDFAGSGKEDIFDRNLQYLTRYANYGPDRNPLAADENDQNWGSTSYINTEMDEKIIVNETKSTDKLDRVSVRSKNTWRPVYIIQSDGSKNGERKIYVCGGSDDKLATGYKKDLNVDDAMKELAEVAYHAKGGLTFNPNVPLKEKQDLGLV